MQPTVKLRLLKSHGFVKGDPLLTDSYGNYYRVQQWWEEIIPLATTQPVIGEWRDIHIEVEE